MQKVTEEEKLAGRGLAASNCISESVHATSTYDLQRYGTISLLHCATGGQSRTSNEFGREVNRLVKGRRATNVKATKDMGGFYEYPRELQMTALMAAKEESKNHMEEYLLMLAKQEGARRRKEEIAFEKNIEAAEEDLLEAMLLLEQYHSDRAG